MLSLQLSPVRFTPSVVQKRRGGSARPARFLSLLLLALSGVLTFAGSSSAAVRYVDTSATGANNGTSWANAYTEVVSAINAAQAGDEIWVASGIYYPDYDPATGQHTGNRALRFQLKSNVALFGGFSGTETERSQRNCVIHRTVLSGDINQRGVFSDNTQTVMASVGTAAITGVLVEGFVIASGNASLGDIGNGNVGGSGGAVWFNGDAEFRYCWFVDNFATYGGAILVAFRTPGSLSLVNCVFANNRSTYVGGAVDFFASGPFSVRNCTIVNNQSSRGSAIGTNTNVICSYFNNLIHSNPSTSTGWDTVETGNSQSVVENNIVEATLPQAGTNNLVVASPRLVRFPSAGPDGRWGTMDDILDGALQPDSPAVNFGAASRSAADSTDLDGDGNLTEAVPYDLLGQPRTANGSPDAGAFEMIAVTARPTLTTLQPDNVTARSATLRVAVNPGGGQTRVAFYLNGINRGTVDAGAGTETVTLELPVSGLLPHTVYTVKTTGTKIETGGVSDGNETTPVTFNTLNTLPIAGADNVHPPAGAGPFVFNVLANDTDADGDLLTITGATDGEKGVVVFSGTAITYTPRLGFNGSDVFTYTISDGAGGTVQGTVTLLNAPPVATSATVHVAEDLARMIILEGSDPDGDAVSYTFGSPVHGTLSGTVSQLFYIPSPNYTGVDRFTFTVNDGRGAVAEGVISINIHPMNDVPTFIGGPNVSVGQDAGPTSIPKWATHIRPGPLDESEQEVRFQLQVDKPELFDVPPAISADGTLTFSPARKASGKATVIVTLKDDGSFADGVPLTSDPQTFTVAVTTFAEEIGSYTGLVAAAPGTAPEHGRTGLIRIDLVKSGNFTGRFTIGGVNFALKGVFDKSGVARFGGAKTADFLLSRKDQTPLTLRLKLDVSEGSDTVIATILEDGELYATGTADRALYTSKRKVSEPFMNVPEHLLGSYTVLFVPKSPQVQGLPPEKFPQGHGSGALKVLKTGVVTLVGTLADGSPVSCSNPLTKANAWPFYVVLDKKTGSAAGSVSFRDNEGVSDLDGLNLQWFKQAGGSSGVYPDGWPEGIQIDLIGSKYVAPSILPGLVLGANGGNSKVWLQQGGLEGEGTSRAIEINARNGKVKVLDASELRLKLAIIPTTGLFSGEFTHPNNQTRTRLKGAVFQKQQLGSGFFMGAAEDGQVHSGLVTIREPVITETAQK